MTKKSIEELADIGHKINNVYMDWQKSIDENQISTEDLDAFEGYLNTLDASMAILNPSAFINGGDSMIILAKEQISILYSFEKFRAMGREKILDIMKFHGLK